MNRLLRFTFPALPWVEIKMKRTLLVLIALAFVIPTIAQAPGGTGGTGGTSGNADPGGPSASTGPKAADKTSPHKNMKMMKKKKKPMTDSSPSNNPSPAPAPQNNP